MPEVSFPKVGRAGVARALTALVLVAAFAPLSPLATSASAETASPPTYWSGPFALAVGSQSMGPPVLVRDPGGGVTVLWVDGIVTAKRWTAADGWETPQRVGGATHPYWTVSAAPDGGGNITAVWAGSINGTQAVVSARLSARSGWSQPTTIATLERGQVADPQVAVSSDGHAWAVWLETDTPWWPGCNCIRGAHSSTEAGWSAPQVIAHSAYYYGAAPTIAALPGPRAMIVWLDARENDSRIRTAFGDTEGRWENGSDAAVGPPGGILKPVLHGRGALGPLLVWQGFAGTVWALRARSFASDAGWAPPVEVSAGNVEGRSAPAFATDDQGTTFLTWPEQDGPTPVSKVRSVNASGEWGPATALTSGREATVNSAAVGAGGGPAVVMWVEADGTTWRYYWSLKEPGQAWQEPVAGWRCPYSCSPFERDYLTLAATAGGALAVWIDTSSGNRTLMQATLAYRDTTPPPLVIDEPSASAVMRGPTVVVSGWTEPGATVEVAGLNAAVGADGSFSVTVAVMPGTRSLSVTARDPAGNVATRDVPVTYEVAAGTAKDWGSFLAGAVLVAAAVAVVQVGRALKRAREPPKGVE